MTREVAFLGKPTLNPFSPGFGQIPETLVGRDELLAELGSGLATGARDVRYTSIMMGVRGSGKTVAVTEIGDRAASAGWVVLALDAGTNGLLGRIKLKLYEVAKRYPALELDELDVSTSSNTGGAVKLGIFQGKQTETVTQNPDLYMGVREQLTYLAQKAQQHNTSVLLTVDELHSIDREEARRLLNDIQHITKREGLPLAFIGAGLLAMRHTILQDKKMTFFHRCEHYELPPLDYADAVRGLRHPIHDFGGTITEDALKHAACHVEGSPYKLQVLGYQAWKLADAPKRPIDIAAVMHATELAQDIVERNISIPALYDLSQSERTHLATLVSLGERASVAEIARNAGTPYSTTRDIHRRLLLSGYVSYQGKLSSLTKLVPADVIRKIVLGEDGTVNHADYATNEIPCRQWMPRSKAYCALREGHLGRCRSKK